MRSETKTSMAGSWFTSLWSDVFCILFSKLLHLRTCVKVRSMSLHLTLQSSLMLLNNVHSKVSFQVLPLGKRKLFGFLKPSISGSTKIWSAFVKEKEMEMLAMFTSLDKVLNCLLPLVVRLLQITFLSLSIERGYLSIWLRKLALPRSCYLTDFDDVLLRIWKVQF